MPIFTLERRRSSLFMEKKKIAVAALSLLLCLAVLISSSYAWLSISRSPEVTGIETNIGSNGSLEIALLSDATFADPTLIKNKIGDSAVIREETVSNLSWGNVIDLTDESYGLNEISLLPASLNVFNGGEGNGSVSSNMLGFVNYGKDGRIERINMESVSTVYSEEGFIFRSEAQSYGVRGIGSVSDTTPNQAVLTSARALTVSYKNSAVAQAKAALSSNGSGIIDICRRGYYLGEETFTAKDAEILRSTAVRMKNALDYVDLALRQGILGYAASLIDDQETFAELRSLVENTSIPLSALSSNLPAGFPSGFKSWITENDEKRAGLQGAVVACGYLKNGGTWEQFSEVLGTILDTEKTYLGNYALSDRNAYTSMIADNDLVFAPGSGTIAHIAEYCGNYSLIFTYDSGTVIEASTSFSGTEANIDWISGKLETLEPVGGEGPSVCPIEDIYGYAIDIAFRCNEEAGLLLQTEAAQRLGTDDELQQNMGGGSYMKFTSEQLSEEQMLMLTDAIRIGFVDRKNNLVAVAKLATTDYTFENGEMAAPIRLYEYELSEGGGIVIGERRPEDAVITELPDDTPTIITAVVWLDGDNIFNSHAAISGQSMTGMLNLQFASDAELIPAEISVTPEE